MSRTPKLSLSFWGFDYNVVGLCISHLSHACYVFTHLMLLDLITLVIFGAD
jgi:hypothetical protein